MKNKIKDFYIPFEIQLIFFTILQYGGAIVIAIILNRVIETLFFMPLFHIFRKKYSKTYHADDFVPCTLHTYIMLAVVNRLSLPMHISLLFIVMISYFTTDVLYHLELYLETRKIKGFKIRFGMDETELINECKSVNLTKLEQDVLIMFYCKRMKRYEIGIKLGYSESNISQIKSKALSKLA